MIAGIILYALAALDPVRLLATAALHFIVGWVFVVISPFFLPRHPEAPPPTRQNPFDAPKTKSASQPDAAESKSGG